MAIGDLGAIIDSATLSSDVDGTGENTGVSICHARDDIYVVAWATPTVEQIASFRISSAGSITAAFLDSQAPDGDDDSHEAPTVFKVGDGFIGVITQRESFVMTYSLDGNGNFTLVDGPDQCGGLTQEAKVHQLDSGVYGTVWSRSNNSLTFLIIPIAEDGTIDDPSATPQTDFSANPDVPADFAWVRGSYGVLFWRDTNSGDAFARTFSLTGDGTHNNTTIDEIEWATDGRGANPTAVVLDADNGIIALNHCDTNIAGSAYTSTFVVDASGNISLVDTVDHGVGEGLALGGLHLGGLAFVYYIGVGTTQLRSRVVDSEGNFIGGDSILGEVDAGDISDFTNVNEDENIRALLLLDADTDLNVYTFDAEGPVSQQPAARSGPSNVQRELLLL